MDHFFMPKPVSALIAALALAAGSWTVLPAQAVFMKIEDVEPGMVGVGRTVFEGSESEEFKVHILGVIRNVVGPQRDLVLARLEGGPLAQTGVMQGMSGSPVYVDGKLLGAVSYSIGAFSKEPIAGITPIAEMTETTALAPRRPAVARGALQMPLTAESVATALRQAYDRVRPFANSPADILSVGLPVAEGARMGSLMRPIATPLVFGGFTPEAVSLLSGPFEAVGFAPVLGGPAGPDEAETSSPRPLQGGDAVGVALMSGDFELGATGTVSYVDGNKVYAFGHPFLGLGPMSFPMTRARVYTLLPSLMSSFKITGTGEVIGTFQQDRSTAIAGTLGVMPELVPVKVTLESGRGLSKTFSFKVVNDQLFTPLLTYVSVFNTLGSYERQLGTATYDIRGRARVKHATGLGDVAIEDIFTGDNSISGAAAAVAGPITMLMTNDRERVDIAGVEITVTSSEEPRIATIERVWLDDVRPRAGSTVPLKILMRSYRGEEQIRTVPVEIPANAPDRVSLLVSDGASLTRWEQREMRREGSAETVEQMIRSLNESHRNNRVYVRLVADEPGAVVEGETLSSLPPSVLAVLEAQRNGGSFVPLRNAVLGEWDLPSDQAVSGARILTVRLEPAGGDRD
jgi:hypothetical protein